MKKTVIAAFAASLIFVLAACGGTPPPEQPPVVVSGMPASVQSFMAALPEDVLVGIGVARLQTTHQSMTMSANRARVAIAQTMDSVVQGMIRDYFGANELTGDTLAFSESISVTLTHADVSGTRMAVIETMPDGTVWSVGVLDRATATQAINQAQVQARLAVPAMASFDAEARMQEAFAQRNAGVPVQTVDN
ncbi:MAG: hypothetical protein FWG66_04765 [Spirochaetes bacterium]|nr:hypothetical protein [Spirochaetota bacterium]